MEKIQVGDTIDTAWSKGVRVAAFGKAKVPFKDEYEDVILVYNEEKEGHPIEAVGHGVHLDKEGRICWYNGDYNVYPDGKRPEIRNGHWDDRQTLTVYSEQEKKEREGKAMDNLTLKDVDFSQFPKDVFEQVKRDVIENPMGLDYNSDHYEHVYNAHFIRSHNLTLSPKVYQTEDSGRLLAFDAWKQDPDRPLFCAFKKMDKSEAAFRDAELKPMTYPQFQEALVTRLKECIRSDAQALDTHDGTKPIPFRPDIPTATPESLLSDAVREYIHEMEGMGKSTAKIRAGLKSVMKPDAQAKHEPKASR